MTNPRRHARDLARALSRAHDQTPTYGRNHVVIYGLAAQADRARSFCDFAFSADHERANALWFCDELTVQLEIALSVPIVDPIRQDSLRRELARAQDHALALRKAVEDNPPRFRRNVRIWAYVYEIVVPGAMRDALAARTRTAALSRARKEEAALDRARSDVLTELVADSQGSYFERADRSDTPGRTCRRLVTLAVYVLPANQRARYVEEFRADLWEVGRSRRLGYAVRLVAYSWSLRRSLVNSAAVAAVTRENS